MPSLYELSEVSISYGRRHGVNRVINSMSMDVGSDEFIAFMGPSGSGKSSLLAALEGFLRPSEGVVRFNGKDIYSFSETDLSEYRNRRIGIVFQFFNLIPHMSAIDNAMLPAMITGLTKREARTKALALLEEMGIEEHADKKVSQLSGGQQQRVAIARALINDPMAILADEPTGNLDSASTQVVCELFAKVHDERKVAIIVVTHDSSVAQYADRIVSLG